MLVERKGNMNKETEMEIVLFFSQPVFIELFTNFPMFGHFVSIAECITDLCIFVCVREINCQSHLLVNDY